MGAEVGGDMRILMLTLAASGRSPPSWNATCSASTPRTPHCAMSQIALGIRRTLCACLSSCAASAWGPLSRDATLSKLELSVIGIAGAILAVAS